MFKPTKAKPLKQTTKKVMRPSPRPAKVKTMKTRPRSY